jgi:hypothetical protein
MEWQILFDFNVGRYVKFMGTLYIYYNKLNKILIKVRWIDSVSSVIGKFNHFVVLCFFLRLREALVIISFLLDWFIITTIDR